MNKADDPSAAHFDVPMNQRGKDVESLHEISMLLNSGLDKRVLETLLELLECGVHPESLTDGIWIELYCIPLLIMPLFNSYHHPSIDEEFCNIVVGWIIVYCDVILIVCLVPVYHMFNFYNVDIMLL